MKGKEGDSKSETEKALQCRRKRLKNFNKNAGALSRSHSGSLCLCRVLSSEEELTYVFAYLIVFAAQSRSGPCFEFEPLSSLAFSHSISISPRRAGRKEGRKEGRS